MSPADTLTPAQTRRAAPVFAALGHVLRIRIVSELSFGEPQSIARLHQGTRMTRQAVTKHLQVLSRAGLVRTRRVGRESLWELEPDRLVEARASLDLISAQWDGALARLKKLVEA